MWLRDKLGRIAIPGDSGDTEECLWWVIIAAMFLIAVLRYGV